jgi:ribonuclease P/MRP protein subunit RPP1
MYYDLCLNYDNPNNLNIDQYRDFCEIVVSAICDNYKLFAINVFKKGNLSINDISTFKEPDLDSIYKTYSLKFVNAPNTNIIDLSSIKFLKRLTIELSDTRELFQFTNPNNAIKSYDILAVLPKNEKMFDAACGDFSVDIITINHEEKINFALKKSLILTAIERNMFFEITYDDFIKNDNRRSTFISNVLLLLDVTKGKNIIISSGSNNFYSHRSPYDILTIFETIFEIDTNLIKSMISENCEKVIMKSIQRKYFKTVISID